MEITREDALEYHARGRPGKRAIAKPCAGQRDLSLAYTPGVAEPLDPQVLVWVAPAVADVATVDGVARRPLDLQAYRQELVARAHRRLTGGALAAD